MTVIVHWAGAPLGLVQRCEICGVVLVDYNNAMLRFGRRPRFFEGAVEVMDSGLCRTLDPPNCSPDIEEKV